MHRYYSISIFLLASWQWIVCLNVCASMCIHCHNYRPERNSLKRGKGGMISTWNILKRKIRLMRKKAKEERRMSVVSEVTVQSRLSIIDLFPLHGSKVKPQQGFVVTSHFICLAGGSHTLFDETTCCFSSIVIAVFSLSMVWNHLTFKLVKQ